MYEQEVLVPAIQVAKDNVKQPMIGGPCTECDRPRKDFPMCFRGDPQCSVNCKKAAVA